MLDFPFIATIVSADPSAVVTSYGSSDRSALDPANSSTIISSVKPPVDDSVLAAFLSAIASPVVTSYIETIVSADSSPVNSTIEHSVVAAIVCFYFSNSIFTTF